MAVMFRQMFMTAKIKSPWSRSIWISLAVSALLSVGCATGPKSVQTAEQASAEPQAISVKTMSVSGTAEGTALHFLSYGMPEAMVKQTGPLGVVVEFDDVAFKDVPKTTKVDDGTIDSILIGSSTVSLTLAREADVAVEQTAAGFDIKVRHKASPVTEQSAVAPKSDPAPAMSSIVKVSADRVDFNVGEPPKSLSGFLLSDGATLVIDAKGAFIEQKQVVEEYTDGPVRRVRMGKQAGNVRTVVVAVSADSLKQYALEKTDTGFALVMSSQQAAPVSEAAETAPTPAPAPATTKAAPAVSKKVMSGEGGGEVSDFGFRQQGRFSFVEVSLSRPTEHVVREATGEKVVVDFKNTRLPKKFVRALDASAFSGPVGLIAAYPKQGGTRLVINLKKPAPFTIEPIDDGIAFVFEGDVEVPGKEADVVEVRAGSDKPTVILLDGSKTATVAVPPSKKDDAPAEAPAGMRGEGDDKFTGQKLSLDFMDADIRNILRLIGEVGGINIVAGPDVSGKVTVRLIDVPWDQALDVILKTNGLGSQREGNVLRVAPQDKLSDEKAKKLAESQALEKAAPLVSDILPVNYAVAGEVVDKIKAILTKRGTATVDERTNSILIKDTEEKIEESRGLVKRLDTPTPQVLIEARIVEVSSTYTKDLGIQWGGTFTADAAHGNATGWAFPDSINLAGDTGVGNYAVNFPSAGGAGGVGGALALSLGHINDILSLDLRLSAIEIAGHGRVVSSPRVTTLDNKTAEISQGVEIPFTTATEEKIETESIDYLLKLNVTPHVTSEGSILMKIDVTKDAPSTTFVAVDSKTPAKETRKANTEVLVMDGETTVIGGIITDTQGFSESGLPWLSKIPVLGWLFKSNTDRVDKTELIIFITPKVVNRRVVDNKQGI